MIPTQDASKRDWALFHASNGFPVFRLKPNTREPIDGVSWVKDATTDPKRIKQWWRSRASDPDEPNIGIAMRGHAALDFDCKPRPDGTPAEGLYWYDVFYLIEDLPDGFRQRTPSGGLHAIFTLLDGVKVANSQSKIRPGVDVRGQNGFVAAAGSVIDDKRYEWLGGQADELPDKFITWCGSPRERDQDASTPLVELDKPTNVKLATRYLIDDAPNAEEGDGGDGTTFMVAAHVRDFGISEPLCLDLMADHWNETKAIPSWDIEDLQRKIANAYSYAQNKPGIRDPAIEFEPSDDLDEPEEPTADTWPIYRDVPEESDLPSREWLYGSHYIRKYLSATVAPGGTGKSFLALTEAVAMATGRDLLGFQPVQRCRVVYWNGEDPLEETFLRAAAICRHHGVERSELKDWLFLDSGRDFDLTLMSEVRGEAAVHRKMVDKIVANTKAKDIDVIIVDPFISTHRVSENDNNKMDRVAKLWASIAGRVNCSVELVHHTTKTRGDEVTADHSRGASAIVNAARSARVINRMNLDEAEQLGIRENDRRSYVRVGADKANLAPVESHRWHRLVGVHLANGENVGAIERWTPPEPTDGLSTEIIDQIVDALSEGEGRVDKRAKNWAGHLVGRIIGFATDETPGKRRAEGVLQALVETDRIEVVKRKPLRRTETYEFYVPVEYDHEII